MRESFIYSEKVFGRLEQSVSLVILSFSLKFTGLISIINVLDCLSVYHLRFKNIAPLKVYSCFENIVPLPKLRMHRSSEKFYLFYLHCRTIWFQYSLWAVGCGLWAVGYGQGPRESRGIVSKLASSHHFEQLRQLCSSPERTNSIFCSAVSCLYTKTVLSQSWQAIRMQWRRNGDSFWMLS